MVKLSQLAYDETSQERGLTMSKNLPRNPPVGKKRYRLICKDPKDNPFRPAGPALQTKIADFDEAMPFSEIERLGKEEAKKAGYEFLRVEAVR